MAKANRSTIITTQLILLLSLTTASLLAMLAPQWVTTTVGAWVLGIVTIIFIVVLLVLTSIASFVDDIDDNSFSLLLRKSTVETTFYPWAFAVYMGRWFHPIDDLQSPLGIAGIPVLMASTWLMIVLGDIVIRNSDKRIWPWLIVLLGYAVGILSWPA